MKSKLLSKIAQRSGPVDTMQTKLAKEQEIDGGFNDEGYWAGSGNAASGVLPIARDTKRICLAWRNIETHTGDCWGTIGGAVKEGLTPEASAQAEMKEEVGYDGGIEMHPGWVFTDGSFRYHNFVGVVDREFAFAPHSHHAWETDEIAWFELEDIRADMEEEPGDYHPELINFFKHSRELIERLVGAGQKKTAKAITAKASGPKVPWQKVLQHVKENNPHEGERDALAWMVNPEAWEWAEETIQPNDPRIDRGLANPDSQWQLYPASKRDVRRYMRMYEKGSEFPAIVLTLPEEAQGKFSFTDGAHRLQAAINLGVPIKAYVGRYVGLQPKSRKQASNATYNTEACGEGEPCPKFCIDLTNTADVLADFRRSITARPTDQKIQLMCRQYKLTPEQAEMCIEADPSPNQTDYFAWIAKQLSQGTVRLPEDKQKLHDQLTRFTKLKRSPGFPGNKDIQGYTPATLFSTLEEHATTAVSNKEKDRSRMSALLAGEVEGAELLAKVGEMVCLEVTDPKVLNELSSSTAWCTIDFTTAQQYLEMGPSFVFYKGTSPYAQFHEGGDVDEEDGDGDEEDGVQFMGRRDESLISEFTAGSRTYLTDETLKPIINQLRSSQANWAFGRFAFLSDVKSEDILKGYGSAAAKLQKFVQLGRRITPPEQEKEILDRTAETMMVGPLNKSRLSVHTLSLLCDYAKRTGVTLGPEVKDRVRGKQIPFHARAAVALYILNEPLPELDKSMLDYYGEPFTSADNTAYVHKFHNPWPEYEQEMLKGLNSPERLAHDNRIHYGVLYAGRILQRRWPEFEPYLLASGIKSYIEMYARDVVKGPWPEPEEQTKTSSETPKTADVPEEESEDAEYAGFQRGQNPSEEDWRKLRIIQKTIKWPATLFRAVDDLGHLNTKHLGVHWTWDEKSAFAYYGSRGRNTPTLLRASVPYSSVDWGETISNNARYLWEEKEITLKDNAPVTLTGTKYGYSGRWETPQVTKVRASVSPTQAIGKEVTPQKKQADIPADLKAPSKVVSKEHEAAKTVHDWFKAKGIESLPWRDFGKHFQQYSQKFADLFTKIRGNRPNLTLTDLEAYLNQDAGESRYDVSTDRYNDPDTSFRDVEQLVVQINRGADAKRILKEDRALAGYLGMVAQSSGMSGHPAADETVGWVRLDFVDDSWLVIDEVQSDLVNSIVQAKNILLSRNLEEYLSRLPTEEGREQVREKIPGNHYFTAVKQHFRAQGYTIEMLDQTKGKIVDLFEDWSEYAIATVLKIARSHGIRAVAMHTADTIARRDQTVDAQKMSMYYNQLAKSFGFKKEEVEIAGNAGTFWVRRLGGGPDGKQASNATYNSEAYQQARDEYSGTWHPEETEEEGHTRRHRSNEWEQATLAALSTGALKPEDIKDTYSIHARDFKPLPQELYHITTAASKVREGGLLSRWEIDLGEGAGLGGGDDKSISFTTSEEIAHEIYDGILLARRAATGELTIEEMLSLAENGTGAKRPFLDDFWGMWQAIHGGGTQHRKAWLGGYRVEPSMLAKAPKNKGDGWEPDTDEHHWTGGDGIERYMWWKRPLTEEEKVEARWTGLKAFLAARERAGGNQDPLFFSTNTKLLAKAPEHDIAILKFKPKPGAMGTQQSALGEWRTYSGKAVELVAEERPKLAALSTGALKPEDIKDTSASMELHRTGAKRKPLPVGLEDLVLYLNADERTKMEVFAETFPEEWWEFEEDTSPSDASLDSLRYFYERTHRLFMHEQPEDCPAFMFLDFVKTVRNGWVAHRTDHAEAIVREGFTKGVADPNRLGLTTMLDDEERKRGGYSFGFPVNDKQGMAFVESISNQPGYGTQIVFAKVDAVIVHHNTDQYNQAIFWGADAKRRVAVVRAGEGWCVLGPDGAEVHEVKTLTDALQWIRTPSRKGAEDARKVASATFLQELEANRENFAQEAQQQWAAWLLPRFDNTPGAGGLAEHIADTLARAVSRHTSGYAEVKTEGDDFVLRCTGGSYQVQLFIPASRFQERTGDNLWRKREGVTLRPQDIVIAALTAEPAGAPTNIQKGASPDYGYSRYNDREKDLNQVEITADGEIEDFGVVAKFNGKDVGVMYCVDEFSSSPAGTAIGGQGGGCGVSGVEIDADWRGTGLGQKMYDEAIAYAKKLGAAWFASDTNMSNDAIRAWERLKQRYPIVEVPNPEYNGADDNSDTALSSTVYVLYLRGQKAKEASSDYVEETMGGDFQRWFKNSVVVDAEGRPVIVYHGTTQEFEDFDLSQATKRRNAIPGERSANECYWFTESKRSAEWYANGGVRTPPGVVHPGGSLIPVYLSLQNPLMVDMASPEYAPRSKQEKSWSDKAYDSGTALHEIGFVKERAIRDAKAKGHDGVVFVNGYDMRPFEGRIFAVFTPSQIRRADRTGPKTTRPESRDPKQAGLPKNPPGKAENTEYVEETNGWALFPDQREGENQTVDLTQMMGPG